MQLIPKTGLGPRHTTYEWPMSHCGYCQMYAKILMPRLAFRALIWALGSTNTGCKIGIKSLHGMGSTKIYIFMQFHNAACQMVDQSASCTCCRRVLFVILRSGQASWKFRPFTSPAPRKPLTPTVHVILMVHRSERSCMTIAFLLNQSPFTCYLPMYATQTLYLRYVVGPWYNKIIYKELSVITK